MFKSALLAQIYFLKSSTSLQQQIRNTFILKRRYDPLLNKTNATQRKLRAKHFIYDLVEDTTIKKRPNIDLVLTTFVDGIGDRGDVVSVKPNFAYNKLLLPGFAVYKTDENIVKYAKVADDQVEEIHSSPFAQRTVNMLSRLTLGIVMNKDEPWVIEPWHIKASLRKAGFICKEECIELPKEKIKGPDLKKENKEFYCTITVNNLEKARLKCRIHHWSTDPSERLPYVVDHWKMPAEPLFGIEDSVKTVNLK